jgi:hypothetical protein
LDEWFVKDVQPRMKGRCFLTRFADDFIMGFELEADARRVMDVLPMRFNRFSLTIHPEKTVLIEFKRPLRQEPSTKGQGTFDFLGFVRHEVAYTAVMTPKGGHNLVCCHQYPTQTCGWSNPAV